MEEAGRSKALANINSSETGRNAWRRTVPPGALPIQVRMLKLNRHLRLANTAAHSSSPASASRVRRN